MTDSFIPNGFGWIRDVPDFRDYTIQHPKVTSLFESCQPSATEDELPGRIDLREYFPAIEEQGTLHASPAFACAAVVEYFQQRVFGSTVHLSKSFLYASTRRIQFVSGNSGVGIRATMKALVRIGAPPAEYCRVDLVDNVDLLNDPFLYSFNRDFGSLVYFRLDQHGVNGGETLLKVKTLLAAGLPVVLGFPVPSSLSTDPLIPYRPNLDAVRGGQAVVAVGFDDDMYSSCRGALLIRSSWGSEWGDRGYGWLPYRYVERGLAADAWAMISRDWIQTGEFPCPPMCRLTLYDAEFPPRANSQLVAPTIHPRPFHHRQNE